MSFNAPTDFARRPVAVIGAGTLGRRIALMFVAHGAEVRINDLAEAQRLAAPQVGYSGGRPPAPASPIRYFAQIRISLARGSSSTQENPMPIQPTLRRTHSLRSGRIRDLAHRVNFPKVGQCFDIEVTRETDGWLIWIPEIGGVTHASRRATVELAAREYIAVRTGIPIGYVTIFVARETR